MFQKENEIKITAENKETGRIKESKNTKQTVSKTLCLACMKRCYSSRNQGIWMPHIATKHRGEHRGEQKDTHGVLQTAGLSRAVHTKAAPALPP